MKTCGDCGCARPAEAFLAGKAKRVSSICAACRKVRAKRHASEYYRTMAPDKRHTIMHKRRADAAGVDHVAYSRTAILMRWRYICAYCPQRATHLDHVHPISKGGPDAESNIVPACADCNLSKGAKTLAEWSESFAPA